MESMSLLLLLLVANGSPILARMLLGDRLAMALDGGLRWRDGRPLLGPSKTWRGLCAAVCTTTLCAPLLGQRWQTGLLIGGLAMLGDALSSFVKRRLGIAPSGPAIGLDHVPESLLPLLGCRLTLGIGWAEILGLTVAFAAADLLLSRLLFRLGVRRHPY